MNELSLFSHLLLSTSSSLLGGIIAPDFGLTHFLLPTCCKDPQAVKLN